MIATAIAMVVGGCSKSKEAVVARLERTTAHVERMPRAGAPWGAARVGDTFIVGSGVRTGAASSAKLRLGTKGNLDVKESSVVYFTRTPGTRDRNDLRVEAGVAELETGDDLVGIGEAVLDPNTHVRVEATPAGTTLVVVVGRGVLENDVIGVGQRVTLDAKGKPQRQTVDAGVTAPSGETTVAVRDKPVRMKTAAGDSELAVGEHPVQGGSTIIVPAGATIEIARGGARAVTTGPAEVRIGEGASLVAFANGLLSLHADSVPAVASLPGGTVTAQPGADATLSGTAKETVIDAQRGETVVTGNRGTETLAAGQSATVTASGDITRLPAPPARTVVSIVAGESPTLHDPRAPTPVRVAFDQVCPRSGVVEVAKDRAFKKLIARSGGAGGANVLVPLGSFSYRVRCPGGRGAAGTLRVAKDSGRTPLPAAAARTTVEMDGREYTILYQNILPELTLLWRTPPRGKTYTFVIKPAKGPEKRVVHTGASLKLLAGELREGAYRVWVEPATGSRSEESRISIEFDNATQSASIEAVEATGGKLRVRGTVIESSTVSAGGMPVTLDRQRRFSTELTPRDHEDGVGVRIAHPKAGIHYYVMRAAPK